MSLLKEPVPPAGVAVIIATRGRPEAVKRLIGRLADQSKLPEHIFVVASEAADVAGLEDDQGRLTLHVGRVGSSLQRNDGLALASEQFAYTVFFDDDFVPSRFWIERMVDLFEARPDIAGLTGTVLADGINNAGIAPHDGEAIVARRDCEPVASHDVHEGFGPYGCNMAFRYSAICGLTFDERLPLYAWLEDTDFGGQVARRGGVARADGLWGVHLGIKAGRARGVRLGYSQIANAVYLAGKGMIPIAFLANRAIRNLSINVARAFWPEPFVDRRGRLLGNIIALADVLRGRITPERAAEL
jgi:GT2 family glycosyltransferase